MLTSAKPNKNFAFDQTHLLFLGFPGGSDNKGSSCNTGDPGRIPGLGRSPEEGNGNPLQYSCLENSMDRGAWWGYSPWGHKESDTTEQLTLSLSLRLSTTHYSNTILGFAPPHP